MGNELLYESKKKSFKPIIDLHEVVLLLLKLQAEACIEVSNSIIETSKHLSSGKCQRFSSDGKNIRGNVMNRNLLIFFLQHVGFIINLKKTTNYEHISQNLLPHPQAIALKLVKLMQKSVSSSTAKTFTAATNTFCKLQSRTKYLEQNGIIQ